MPKFHRGWWFPDHEQHLTAWMDSKKNKVEMNGRSGYQGQKQIAALKRCTSFRHAVDVGAHVGLWSRNLAFAFDVVTAFEPVAEHRECFMKNVQGIGQVNLLPFALGAKPGMVSIETEVGSSGNSAVGGLGEIEMRTLDAYGFDDLDFLKIDVEGLEENVLRGGEETIKACRPVVIVEQKREMSLRFGLPTLGAVHLLESWGYKVEEEISGDYILKVPA
jgi:FkbM family methyltransferase